MILLLGKNGQVGYELRHSLKSLGEVVALGRDELDLASPDRIRRVVREIDPTLIVNAAAYTAVDRAESEPDLAIAVNGTAPGILAEEARQLGAGLVHYSTDFVFDGFKHDPYTEEDSPKPLNVYGLSKLTGERAILAAGVPHLTLRTSWVYSLRRECFVTRILSWARERRLIRVVDDQISNPTWCQTVALTTVKILEQGKGEFFNFLDEWGGLYHLASQGEASRYQWAASILELAHEIDEYSVEGLMPAKTRDFPSPAKRPTYSALDSSLLATQFGIDIPHWQSDLRTAFLRMKAHQ